MVPIIANKDERRGRYRYKLDINRANNLTFISHEKVSYGKLKDISKDGLGFISEIDLSINLKVNNIIIIYLFYSNKHVKYFVTVRHIHNNICGCKFISKRIIMNQSSDVAAIKVTDGNNMLENIQ